MEKLTYQEEETMRFIWHLGPCFVKEIVACYDEPKPPYTTVASIVNNLKRKGYLKAEKFGNTYRYTPLVAQEEYTRNSVATSCATILPTLTRRWCRSSPRSRKSPRTS